MNRKIIFGLGVFLLSFLTAQAASTVALSRNLRLGDRGADVTLLQQLLNVDPATKIAESGPGSPGFETDFFGQMTRVAVMKFQDKYRDQVLYPAAVYAPTGYVGVLTRAKLTSLASAGAPVLPTKSSSFPQNPAPFISSTSTKPVVYSVFPTYVRRGDTVTVTGANFTPAENTVELGDGPIGETFNHLSSSDGKTITFVYEPPTLQTMTEDQLKSLPADDYAQLQSQLQAKGLTLHDIANQYPGIVSESQLRDTLAKNGYTADGLYHYFHVIVGNGNGKGISQTALLHGIRKFPFDTVAGRAPENFFSNLRENIASWADDVTHPQIARAQGIPGGGFYSLIMVCTCSGALVTLNIGTGGGLMVWQTGQIPMAGSCRIGGFWLGYSIPGAGVCPMYVGLACATLTFNMPMPTFGCNL